MTKEEARHWFVTVLIDIGIVLIGIVICVRYTNHKVNDEMKTIDEKLDTIIELLK